LELLIVGRQSNGKVLKCGIFISLKSAFQKFVKSFCCTFLASKMKWLVSNIWNVKHMFCITRKFQFKCLTDTDLQLGVCHWIGQPAHVHAKGGCLGNNPTSVISNCMTNWNCGWAVWPIWGCGSKWGQYKQQNNREEQLKIAKFYSVWRHSLPLSGRKLKYSRRPLTESVSTQSQFTSCAYECNREGDKVMEKF